VCDSNTPYNIYDERVFIRVQFKENVEKLLIEMINKSIKYDNNNLLLIQLLWIKS